MKIKICGLTREIDIDYVNQAKPDYVGFVFAPSRRQVTIDQAKQLKQKLDSSILSVGVFVDAPINLIMSLVDLGIIDLVQLHGHEEDDYIEELKQKIACPIIKAIRIGAQEMRHYDVDYYLFDGIAPGSGQKFDWSLLKDMDKPYFLAGGINTDNYQEAMKQHAYALDCSSGVETDGFKDCDKIMTIVKGVHNE